MSDDLDEFMGGIGLDVAPVSAEDNIMGRLTGQGTGSAKYQEIHNLRYQLIHEMYTYFYLLEDGCILMRQSNITKDKVIFTRMDFARSRIKYYLLSRYYSYFDKRPNSMQRNLGPADLNKVCDLVMKYDVVARLLAVEKVDDLPKLNFGR